MYENLKGKVNFKLGVKIKRLTERAKNELFLQDNEVTKTDIIVYAVVLNQAQPFGKFKFIKTLLRTARLFRSI